MTDWLHIHRGTEPLLVSIPHAGTTIPAEIAPALVSHELAIHDADWFIPQLYGFAGDLGATVVSTDISRTAIDVNRDPSGASLYPGQATTGLCPDITFDGEPLYRDGGPDQVEIDRRRVAYFDPYHAAIRAELDRLRGLHDRVVIFDAHSIRSHVERLFDGELPALNLGTNGGTSAAPELEAQTAKALAASPFTSVVNGRFKGGWITRCYGQPADGVHALQLEIAQRAYMDEPTGLTIPTWDPDRAAALQAVLKPLLQSLIAWARS